MVSNINTGQYSISKLAQKYGLSRSTLLYYEKIGLLTASGRTPAGYRFYNSDDAERLDQILVFREMGIALKEIEVLLFKTEIGITPVLIKQLSLINQEIQDLREQQRRIIDMLRKTNNFYYSLAAKNPTKFQAILVQAGINTPADALNWHRKFDQASPEEHINFLKAIGFTGSEIDELIHLLKTSPGDILKNFLKNC